MKESTLWKFILDKLTAGCNVGLMLVAESSDSTPGRRGFKMALASDGTQYGTIGGGIMEYNLLKSVTKRLNETNPIAEVHYLQHSRDTEEEKSGLICGGRQTVVIKYLDKSDIDAVSKIADNFSANKNGLLKITNDSFSFEEVSRQEEKPNFKFQNFSNWELTEDIGFPKTVYVVGSGHVGVAVCRVFAGLGFRTVVFDHRKDIFSKVENNYADEKIITPYKDVGDFIEEGNNSYVVIVSPQHTGDKDALGSVIRKKVKYIGMMGSQKKITTIFNLLGKEGVSTTLFKLVHAPIGLEIKAETPSEIAISIAAEIITLKNKNN
jgi:xanthine dehydrogenase accessory factor